MALAQPKKPVGGAFGFFQSESRPAYLNAYPGMGASVISRMAAKAWKKQSAAQMAPFEKKYEVAKAQFDKDMAAFLASGGVKEKGIMARRTEKRKAKESGKTKKVKDPNAPKKPAGGGYGQLLLENREKIKKSLPEGHKITDVAKAAGAQWKALSDTAKKPFDKKFQTKMAEFHEAMEKYKLSSSNLA